MIAIRPTVESDLPQLSALFEERFGHALSAAEWSWKYERLPGVSRSLVAVGSEGSLLAHAGALCLQARWRDGEGGIWQLTDFVAAPRGRGLHPPLVELGQELLGDLPRVGDAPWIFGFPSARHFRLGERVFGYQRATSFEPLVGELPTVEPPDGAVIEVTDHCAGGLEATWASSGVLGVERGAAFLNWRYYSRPVRYYRFYRLVGRGETSPGLAVFAFVGESAWAAELWLPDSGEWYPSMLAVAADLRRSGLRTWHFWPPHSTSGRNLLTTLGLRGSGEQCLVACRARPGDDPVAPAAGFTYSMGDYDLV